MSTITKDLGMVTAYAYAVSQGYTGTEEEFAELMASYAEVAEEAAESARQAAASATSAGQSATNAAGSASTANTKAGEAATSAQTATTKAGEAATSANNAAGSATTASNAANTATTKASEASQSASNAAASATTANNAADDATAAKTAAETAQTAAEAAQTAAEEAKDIAVASSRAVLINEETEASNPLVITDGADNLPVKDCVVNIQPSQPNAYDSVWVGGAGKNKFRLADFSLTASGVTYTYNSAKGTITKSGTTSGSGGVNVGTITLPSGTYTLSATFNETGTKTYIYLREVSSDTNVGSISMGSSPITLTLNGEYYIRLATEAGETSGTISNIQIESGSTATTWTPYSNICPISGWTEADIHRCGVNQWDEEWELGIYNVSNGEKVSNTNAIRCKNPIPVLPNTSYFKHVGGDGACTYGCYYDEDGNFISCHSAQKNTIFVTPENCYHMTFYCESSYGTTYNNNISINYLSTDTSYHAYEGATYSVDLSSAGTVYGGTLDVTTGVLTVDRAINVLDGTQNIGFNGTLPYGGVQLLYTPTPAKKLAPSEPEQNDGLLSDKFASVVYPDNEYELTGRSTNANVIINMPASVTSKALAQQWFADNPTQLVYNLATPQTYQLTPTEVTTLLKNNTLTANCGTVSLSYYADTKTYIDNAIATAVASL